MYNIIIKNNNLKQKNTVHYVENISEIYFSIFPKHNDYMHIEEYIHSHISICIMYVNAILIKSG